MLHSLQVAVYLPCICTERSTTRSTFYPRHFPPSAPPLLCIDLHEISTRAPSYKSTRTPPSSSALLEEKKRIDYLSFYIYIGIRVHLLSLLFRLDSSLPVFLSRNDIHPTVHRYFSFNRRKSVSRRRKGKDREGKSADLIFRPTEEACSIQA